MPVRLKPVALWSRAKHSITEPLRSLVTVVISGILFYLNKQ